MYNLLKGDSVLVSGNFSQVFCRFQALGPRATSEYTRDCANVSKVESCLVKVRRQVYDLLKGQWAVRISQPTSDKQRGGILN